MQSQLSTEYMIDGKICSRCKVFKQASMFSKNTRSKIGLQSKCRQCVSELHFLNREKRLKTQKAYYEKNKEKINKSNMEWAAKNRDVVNRNIKKWKEKNKELVYFYTATRRARKKNATPAWADVDRIKYKYAHCHWLNKTFGYNMHVDHIIPLSGKNVCGLHVHTNLQIIPAEENMKKSNRVLEDL